MKYKYNPNETMVILTSDKVKLKTKNMKLGKEE